MAGRRRPVEVRASRARAAAVALPRAKRRLASGSLARFAPSARSLAVGLGLLALAAGAYAVARQTSAFAIGRLEIAGAPAGVEQQVRRALAPFVGTSLLALNGSALERRAAALPTVVSVHYDRAFPHALRIEVVAEVRVAVLHRG